MFHKVSFVAARYKVEWQYYKQSLLCVCVVDFSELALRLSIRSRGLSILSVTLVQVR